ncbi:hypothetical protein [Candidatus Villigracilis affinis]|uniref:hypothetical protein n=1 Tax=Candidatus Villigracilis affinis TaxID=3140682 RepID=UPI002A1B9938|nr:hypothetical protein [Anaerolineales bacterium]
MIDFDIGGLYQILYVKWNDEKIKTISTLTLMAAPALSMLGKQQRILCDLQMTAPFIVDQSYEIKCIDNRFVLEEGHVGIGFFRQACSS